MRRNAQIVWKRIFIDSGSGKRWGEWIIREKGEVREKGEGCRRREKGDERSRKRGKLWKVQR